MIQMQIFSFFDDAILYMDHTVPEIPGTWHITEPEPGPQRYTFTMFITI